MQTLLTNGLRISAPSLKHQARVKQPVSLQHALASRSKQIHIEFALQVRGNGGHGFLKRPQLAAYSDESLESDGSVSLSISMAGKVGEVPGAAPYPKEPEHSTQLGLGCGGVSFLVRGSSIKQIKPLPDSSIVSHNIEHDAVVRWCRLHGKNNEHNTNRFRATSVRPRCWRHCNGRDQEKAAACKALQVEMSPVVAFPNLQYHMEVSENKGTFVWKNIRMLIYRDSQIRQHETSLTHFADHLAGYYLLLDGSQYKSRNTS